MKDKDTKESKGFAFIMFTNSDAAQKAIEGIHEREFKVTCVLVSRESFSCCIKLYECTFYLAVSGKKTKMFLVTS